jgi:hypothetical protein
LQFNQCVGLIKKRAKSIALLYNVPYEDTVAQGYLIYVESLKTYDPDKGAFITHLHHNLLQLHRWATKEKRELQNLYNQHQLQERLHIEASYINLDADNWYDYILGGFCPDYTMDIQAETSIQGLSQIAQSVLYFIVSREWEVLSETPTKISKNKVMKAFSKTIGHTAVEKSWNELKLWWNEKGKNIECFSLIF